jgi:hypothetical protein
MARHRYNVIPSDPDPRDAQYHIATCAAAAPVLVQLPRSVWLATPPRDNQGQEGSCTGESLTAAMEMLALAQGVTVPPLSAAALYYWEREQEGNATQDNGAQIRTGLDILVKRGVCTDGLFPYIPGDYRTAPPAAAVTEAAKYKLAAYHRCSGLTDIRYALANRMACVIGFIVLGSFENIGPDGLVPDPTPTDPQMGGHATALFGYDDQIARVGDANSWGIGWAKDGLCYLPYGSYFGDVGNSSPIFEAWALEGIILT